MTVQAVRASGGLPKISHSQSGKRLFASRALSCRAKKNLRHSLQFVPSQKVFDASGQFVIETLTLSLYC